MAKSHGNREAKKPKQVKPVVPVAAPAGTGTPPAAPPATSPRPGRR